MVKRWRRTFIKEWRTYRGLNQTKLAELCDTTQATISRWECGRTPYDQPMLEAIADALRCEPGDLIMRDPSKEDHMWSIWEQIPPEARPVVVSMMRGAMKKTGATGGE